MGLTLALEQFPKSVKRFSDKNCGENKELEQERDSEIAHSALEPVYDLLCSRMARQKLAKKLKSYIRVHELV